MISYLYESILHIGVIFYPLYFLAFLGWFFLILVFAFIYSERLLESPRFFRWTSKFFWKIQKKKWIKPKEEEKDKVFFFTSYCDLNERSFLDYARESFKDTVWGKNEDQDKKRFIYFIYLSVLVPYFNYIKTVRVIAGIAPLLGLLGTVSGMIDTFGVISLYGNANPALMADGISKALLTTQAGLCVALPLLFLSGYANGLLKKMQNNLNKLLI